MNRMQKASEKSQITAKTNFRLELSTVENDDRPVYVLGNFNSWAVDDEQFRLKKVSNGKYVFDFPPYIRLPRPFEYKYTRGGWKNVELDAYGSRVSNRWLAAPEGLIQDRVPRWRKNGLIYESDYLPHQMLLGEKFEMPQLGKTRRIRLLIPHDYNLTDKRYPVLYMHDAQNLFDKYSPYGNWAIDEKLAIMAEQGFADLIIVCIDHGNEHRIKEFTPFRETKVGIGEGKKYLRFIADTLKPYVDSHFRTKSDQASTGIGGSSMGGLISAYAGAIYPEVFGRLLIFSPSFWVAPDLYKEVAGTFNPDKTKVYLYGGGKEGASMLPNLQAFQEALKTTNYTVELSVDHMGTHNESRWGMEFPKAIEWLFFT